MCLNQNVIVMHHGHPRILDYIEAAIRTAIIAQTPFSTNVFPMSSYLTGLIFYNYQLIS